MRDVTGSDVLKSVKAEVAAHVKPPIRRLGGAVRVLVNDCSAAIGAATRYEEPVGRQWQRVLGSGGGIPPCGEADGLRVLIAAGYGLSAAKLAMETTLAAALLLRGAQPLVLSCDAALAACEFNPFGSYQPDPGDLAPPLGPRGRMALCDRCRHDLADAFAPLGLAPSSLRAFRHADDRQRLQSLVDSWDVSTYRSAEYRSIRVGEHAFSSMLRATLRGTLEDDDRTQQLFRRYLVSAMEYVDLIERLFEAERPQRVVAVHGVYLVHGVLCEVARKHRIPVIVWGFPYRKGTVWLSHDDSYHRTLVSESAAAWEHRALSPTEAAQLDEYFDSKRGGGRDYVNYHPRPEEDRARIVEALALDPDKPVVSLYTNVIWDAQIYYDFNVFDSMLEWLTRTIEYFAHRTDVQLVIRVHPAEVKGGMPTNQPLVPEIEARFPELPPNVRVVPPESDISSYTLAEMSCASLIYGTKMGLEIAVRGVPVIVAGETFNRGKGFTYDVESQEHYRKLLDRITSLPRNSPEMIERARRYAHYLFFRRMIDFPLVQVEEPQASIGVRLGFATVADLAPGADRALDCVCDGIVHGTSFVIDDALKPEAA
ncbi:MAG TPA: hypothetical protein VK912_12035 [Longimicrobiales bacterium]|nr:hypothetical protein [Longimicrobiales bacterium]